MLRYPRRVKAGTRVGQWSRVAFTYRAETGDMAFFIDGEETARQAFATVVTTLQGSGTRLAIGGSYNFV